MNPKTPLGPNSSRFEQSGTTGRVHDGTSSKNKELRLWLWLWLWYDMIWYDMCCCTWLDLGFGDEARELRTLEASTSIQDTSEETYIFIDYSSEHPFRFFLGDNVTQGNRDGGKIIMMSSLEMEIGVMELGNYNTGDLCSRVGARSTLRSISTERKGAPLGLWEGKFKGSSWSLIEARVFFFPLENFFWIDYAVVAVCQTFPSWLNIQPPGRAQGQGQDRHVI